MIGLLIAQAIAAASPAAPALADVEQAIAAGRTDQARAMIGRLVAAKAADADILRVSTDLAFAVGDSRAALAGYGRMLHERPDDPRLLERAAIAALKLGHVEVASGFAARATALPAASWRAWNARGVAADLRADWADAADSYAEAARRAPDRPELFNNLGWSLLLQGRWDEAIEPLEQAARLHPDAPRTSANLELARAATAADLPRRGATESRRAWAARLNDAGMIAALRGDRARAIAAFAQAIDARDIWFDRAANNLAAVQRTP